MKNVMEQASEYAEMAAIAMPTSPDDLRAVIRLSFYSGYQAALGFARSLVVKPESDVCPDCHGKGGKAIAPNGAVVHYCNCEVPA
jgi:hypothetical protein